MIVYLLLLFIVIMHFIDAIGAEYYLVLSPYLRRLIHKGEFPKRAGLLQGSYEVVYKKYKFTNPSIYIEGEKLYILGRPECQLPSLATKAYWTMTKLYPQNLLFAMGENGTFHEREFIFNQKSFEYGEVIWRFLIEDMTLFKNNDVFYLRGYVKNPAWIVRPFFAKLDIDEGKLTKIWDTFIIDGEEYMNKEKNWIYISADENNLYFLTHCWPVWKIIKLNMKNGTFTTFLERPIDVPESYHGAHLTSAIVPFTPNTYLTIFHTSKDGGFYFPYSSFFVLIDKDSLLPIYLSDIFVFSTYHLEFPMGLAIKDDDVYIGIGIDDIQFQIRKYKKDFIRSMVTKVAIG